MRQVMAYGVSASCDEEGNISSSQLLLPRKRPRPPRTSDRGFCFLSAHRWYGRAAVSRKRGNVSS